MNDPFRLDGVRSKLDGVTNRNLSEARNAIDLSCGVSATVRAHELVYMGIEIMFC